MEHEPDDEPLLRSTRLPPVTPAALRTSLDDHQVRARELRQALDELKAELDGGARRGAGAAAPKAAAPATAGPPGDSAPARRPGRARRLGLGAVAALAAVAAGVGVVHVVSWSLAGSDRVAGSSVAASAPSPSTSASGTPTPTPVASTTPPAPTAPAGPARPAVVLPRGLPAGGPGADAPGAEMTALLGRRGTVDVYERLVVRPGTTSVRLALAPASALPRPLRGIRARVTGLRVAVDGRAVAARADHRGWRVTPADGAPFTRVVVHYRLAGALVRVAPAPPGRVTLVLRPLTGAAAGTGRDPVVVRLRDRRIGAVYCPSAPQPLCAVSRGARHLATVPAGARPIVLAQVSVG